MFTDIHAGIRHLLRGFSLLNQPGVRLFVIIPFLINLLVFSLFIWFAADRVGGLIERLVPTLPDWLAWVYWLFWLFFALLALLLVFFTFTLVANLIGAPFNGLLAERVATRLGMAPLATSPDSLFAGMWQDFRQELRKFAYFAWRALLLLLLSAVLFFIPLVNALIPALWFLFGAWMLALEYSDFHLANRGFRLEDQKALLSLHRWSAWGFGAAATLGSMIPLVNFLIMPAAVAGAVSLWVEKQPSIDGDSRR